ncbi:MAG: S-layer homology domain-containing protein, partial [Clostridia bacterium]|nr:S-layer homology domain-containing protein [Clostridia bacterium]
MKKLLTLILSALMLLGVFSLAAAGEDSPFTDVKTSRWSYGAVLYAYKNGYMNGVGDGRFDPAGTMTRGMVVTVLWRRDGSPAVEFADDFDDVKEGKYYSSAVIWAKNNGIVNGVSEGKFDPGGKITREQLAAMLNRYTEYHGLDFRPCGRPDSFPDASEAHSYAKDALSWATGKGL